MRSKPILTVIAVLALVMCSGGHAIASEPFAEPRPGLFTGGVPAAQELAQLAKRGVTTVIDLRTADERGASDTVAPSASELGLTYLALPIADANDLSAANAERLRSALDAGDGLVLLHCSSGNRAGALLALMAYHEEGMSRRDALALGRRAGLKDLEGDVDRLMRRQRRR